MKYKYPYVLLRGKYFPIIPLIVSKSNTSVPIVALIDSGAVISLFDASIGQALGLNIESGESYNPKGIGGSIRAYLHNVILKIGDVEIDVKVGFTDQLSVPINLLGRDGFFETFLILFNDKEKSVSLEKI